MVSRYKVSRIQLIPFKVHNITFHEYKSLFFIYKYPEDSVCVLMYSFSYVYTIQYMVQTKLFIYI